MPPEGEERIVTPLLEQVLRHSSHSRAWLEVGIRLVRTDVKHDIGGRYTDSHLIDLERAGVGNAVDTLETLLIATAGSFNMLKAKSSVLNALGTGKLHLLGSLEAIVERRLGVDEFSNRIVKAGLQNELSAHVRVLLVQRFDGSRNLVDEQSLGGHVHLATSIFKLEDNVARGDIWLPHVHERAGHNDNIGSVHPNLIERIEKRLVVQTVAGGVRSRHGHDLDRLAILPGLVGRAVVVPHELIDGGLDRLAGRSLANALGDHLATRRVESLDGNDLAREERVRRTGGGEGGQIEVDASSVGVMTRSLQQDGRAVDLALMSLDSLGVENNFVRKY